MALAPSAGAIEIHDACHELAPELEKGDQLGRLPEVARVDVLRAYLLVCKLRLRMGRVEMKAVTRVEELAEGDRLSFWLG
jgi:hypothetical protein